MIGSKKLFYFLKFRFEEVLKIYSEKLDTFKGLTHTPRPVQLALLEVAFLPCGRKG